MFLLSINLIFLSSMFSGCTSPLLLYKCQQLNSMEFCGILIFHSESDGIHRNSWRMVKTLTGYSHFCWHFKVLWWTSYVEISSKGLYLGFWLFIICITGYLQCLVMWPGNVMWGPTTLYLVVAITSVMANNFASEIHVCALLDSLIASHQ